MCVQCYQPFLASMFDIIYYALQSLNKCTFVQYSGTPSYVKVSLSYLCSACPYIEGPEAMKLRLQASLSLVALLAWWVCEGGAQCTRRPPPGADCSSVDTICGLEPQGGGEGSGGGPVELEPLIDPPDK